MTGILSVGSLQQGLMYLQLTWQLLTWRYRNCDIPAQTRSLQTVGCKMGLDSLHYDGTLTRREVHRVTLMI